MLLYRFKFNEKINKKSVGVLKTNKGRLMILSKWEVCDIKKNEIF